jgi:hypothetical protein
VQQGMLRYATDCPSILLLTMTPHCMVLCVTRSASSPQPPAIFSPAPRACLPLGHRWPPPRHRPHLRSSKMNTPEQIHERHRALSSSHTRLCLSASDWVRHALPRAWHRWCSSLGHRPSPLAPTPLPSSPSRTCQMTGGLCSSVHGGM